MHGELTEDLEWKDRQGLEWKGFRLLAVTAFFLNGRGAAGASARIATKDIPYIGRMRDMRDAKDVREMRL